MAHLLKEDVPLSEISGCSQQPLGSRTKEMQSIAQHCCLPRVGVVGRRSRPGTWFLPFTSAVSHYLILHSFLSLSILKNLSSAQLRSQPFTSFRMAFPGTPVGHLFGPDQRMANTIPQVMSPNAPAFANPPGFAPVYAIPELESFLCLSD